MSFCWTQRQMFSRILRPEHSLHWFCSPCSERQVKSDWYDLDIHMQSYYCLCESRPVLILIQHYYESIVHMFSFVSLYKAVKLSVWLFPFMHDSWEHWVNEAQIFCVSADLGSGWAVMTDLGSGFGCYDWSGIRVWLLWLIWDQGWAVMTDLGSAVTPSDVSFPSLLSCTTKTHFSSCVAWHLLYKSISKN